MARFFLCMFFTFRAEVSKMMVRKRLVLLSFLIARGYQMSLEVRAVDES